MTEFQGLKLVPQGDLEIVVTREFDAPRRLVFEALTTPELLKQWLGVHGGWTFSSCEIDLTAGGAYRFVWTHADGQDMTASGVCRDLARPRSVSWTEVFEPVWYPGQALVTHELSERDGRTTLQLTLRYESLEARDAVLSSPIKDGVAASYDLLDDLLKLRQEP